MYYDLGPSEIRLLQIHRLSGRRRNDLAEIVCELVTVGLGLEDVPPYTALSYVWGSSALTRTITVDGQRTLVTENLFLILEALSIVPSRTNQLRELLPPPAQQYFWIDGLCINQNDHKEKAIQVAMMGRIYRKASLTLMWIRDSTDESREALEWFSTVAQMEEEDFKDYVKAGQLVHLFNESAWNALCDFLVQPYFRRRWIIQEIALSPDPWLVCGETVIDWRTIEIGYDRVCCKMHNEVSLSRTIKSTDIETIAAVFTLRWRIRNGVNTTLSEILVRLRRCDTTEPRDRIYAVRALCSDTEASRIPVTYEAGTTITDIFTQQTIAHICAQDNLDVLCICQERNRIERRDRPYEDSNGLTIQPNPPGWPRMTFLPDLPTWVPNWTSQIRPVLPNLDQALQSKILTTTGIHIDTVQYIEPTTPPPYPIPRNPASEFYMSCFKLYQLIPLHKTPFQTEADRLDSFWRTITLGGHKLETHDFFTIEYIRHRCLTYFQGSNTQTRLGNELARRGFYMSPIKPPQDHWFTRKNVPAVYFEPNQHDFNFDHLPAFRFFVTRSGRMGLGPPRTQPGDHVCVLFGCSSPMLLQQHQGQYQIRGDAYVDGYMHGEAIQMLEDGELHERIFPII